MTLRFALAAMLVCGATLLAGPAPSRAQNPFIPNMAGTDGISVYGTGELSIRPNMVEIDLHVAGKAELTGDALVKYRDAKKRVLEALDKLKLQNLTTDELGLTISAGTSIEQQQRMMNGMPQVPTKTQIEVSCTLRVKLKDVRGQPPEELMKIVGKLLDVAQDSGVTIFPGLAQTRGNVQYGYNANNFPAAVRFVVSDLAEIREKAYEQAVADARSRATRLAKLSHLKLGSALSVQEIQVAGDQQVVNPNYGNVQAAVAVVEGSDNEQPRLTSMSLSAVAVQVRLLVRFAIVPPDPATAQQ